MTLHNLKVFCTVCEEGTMSSAAKKLNMTQSGVSKIITEMEKLYKVVLFVRREKKLHLTAEGKALLDNSRKVLQAYNRLENNMLHTQTNKAIVFGYTSGFDLSIISDIEHDFHEKYPDCKLFLRDNYSKRIREKVIRGECDLAMVQSPSVDERLHQEVFCSNSLVAVCSPDYKLNSQSKTLTFADLANENLILLEKDRATRTIVDKLALENEVTMNPFWTSSSPSNVKELAARGEGVAILFEIHVRGDLNSGRLVQVPTTFNVKQDFYIIYRKDTWLTENQLFLINLCRKHAPKIK